jgi:hypothetical protein
MNGLVHQCLRFEEAQGELAVLVGQRQSATDEARLANDLAGIDQFLGNVGVVSVARQGVHSVDTERAGHQLTELPLAPDQIGNPVRREIV